MQIHGLVSLSEWLIFSREGLVYRSMNERRKRVDRFLTEFLGWGVDYLKYDNCYNEGQAGTQLLSYTR